MQSDLSSPAVIKKIMNASGLKFNKKLGQNFLIDRQILLDTAEGAQIGKEHTLLEIGAGVGSLTQILAERAGRVVAVELDRGLASVLRSNFAAYDNVEIIEGDILKLNLRELAKKLSPPAAVVANLPYYITTPIIMALLESGLPFESITVMVQLEVAERMTAPPGGKAYGALTLAVGYYTQAEIIVRVPPESFMPPPAVSSAVVRLRPVPPRLKEEEREKLFRVIRAAFAQRRKTLVNSLSAAGGSDLSRAEIAEAIEKTGHKKDVRGERLSLEDYITLSRLV